MAPPPSPISPPEALELHRRLVEGDPVAPSDLAVAFLDYLGQWLMVCYPNAAEDLCWEAAEEAIIAVIKQPERFDPERGALDAYLRMAADGDLRNLLRSETRRRNRHIGWGAVELSPRLGKYIQDRETDPSEIIVWEEAIVERLYRERRQLAALQAGLTPQEARALELMRTKERRTERYAAALGITHLPLPEQRAEVKRVKDRLIKRIQRTEAPHV